ncbi:MAG: ubiquitin-conjugating enzyme E2 [Planctomycetota bacterium]
MRKSPRERRLLSDYKGVQQLMRESSIFSFEASGKPPQRYRLFFKGHGLFRPNPNVVEIRDHHEILIDLGAAYPRMVPNLAWQTPVFHPNISNNGVVCLGGYGKHWVPSLTLAELCTMLWDMIRYKNFDVESPYNREAALWAKTQNAMRLPLDPRSIRDRVENNSFAPQKNSESGTSVEIVETGIEVVSRPQPPLDDVGIVFRD